MQSSRKPWSKMRVVWRDQAVQAMLAVQLVGAEASAAATPRGTATSGAAAVGHDTLPSAS